MGIRRDTGLHYAASLVPAVIAVIATPFYIQLVGIERFGLLALCWTILAAFSFTSLGMGAAVTFHLAQMAEAPSAERSEFLWTAVGLSLIASAVGAALVWLGGSFYFDHAVEESAELRGEITRTLPLLAAMLPLAISVGVFNSALQGRRSFGWLSVVSTIYGVLTALLPLAAAIWIGQDLLTLVWMTALANAATLALQLLLCRRLVPLNRPSWPRKGTAKALLDYGSWASAIALLAPILLAFDRFVIGALRGPAAVGAYVLPFQIVQRLIMFPGSLSSATLPRFAELTDEHQVQRLQTELIALLNGLLTPLSIVGIATIGPLLRIWVGSEIAIAATPVGVILFLGAWMHGIGHVPSVIVLGRNRPDLLAKLLLVYLIPYALLLYAATKYFGIVGAAFAWTLRATFDSVLFIYTRPRVSDLISLALSGAIVSISAIFALSFPWTTLIYWCLLLIMLAVACWRGRQIIWQSWQLMRRKVPGG